MLPDGKLHKLRYPMCLLVAAEDQALAKTMAERVVENAEQAGVAVKRGRCAPNTLIAGSFSTIAMLMEEKALEFLHTSGLSFLAVDQEGRSHQESQDA